MAKNIQEHLEQIKSQRAPWDEAKSADRDARLAAWYNKIVKLPAQNELIKILVTHNRPHVDEVLEMWLAAKYPSAPVGDIRGIIRLDELEDIERPFGEGIVLRSTPGLYEGVDWLTHWRNGVRLLGTGGGVLDEHPVKGEPRIEGESGATLMARLLGVVNRPELNRLLNVVRENDTKGSRAFVEELLVTVKEGHRDIDWDRIHLGSTEDKKHQLVVIRNGLIVLNKITERELKLIEEFKTKANTWSVDQREDIHIGSIQSNSPFMADYMRQKVPVSIMIIRRSTGHTVVMCNTSRGNDSQKKNKVPDEITRIIAQEIRKAEARLHGRRLPQNNSELIQEDCESAPEWHFTSGNLLNSSESAPDMPVTGLKLWEIEDIVTEVVAARASRIREWKKGEKDKKSQQYKQQAQEKK